MSLATLVVSHEVPVEGAARHGLRELVLRQREMIHPNLPVASGVKATIAGP
jgi:hypothetical protein